MKMKCPFALKTHGGSNNGENEEREHRFKFRVCVQLEEACKIIACAMMVVVGKGLGKKACLKKKVTRFWGEEEVDYLCIPIDLFFCILF